MEFWVCLFANTSSAVAPLALRGSSSRCAQVGGGAPQGFSLCKKPSSRKRSHCSANALLDRHRTDTNSAFIIRFLFHFWNQENSKFPGRVNIWKNPINTVKQTAYFGKSFSLDSRFQISRPTMYELAFYFLQIWRIYIVKTGSGLFWVPSVFTTLAGPQLAHSAMLPLFKLLS